MATIPVLRGRDGGLEQDPPPEHYRAETLVSQQNFLGPLWQMLATGEACWPVGEELGLGVR